MLVFFYCKNSCKNFHNNQLDTAFRPTMEPINVLKNKILVNVAGSLKTSIPTRTVPTAPIPVQTAYAVPIGSVCVAFIRSVILIESAIKNPVYHKIMVLPVAVFAFPRQNANPTSKRPAIIKIIQLISFTI